MLNLSLFKEVFFQSRIPQMIGQIDMSNMHYNPAFCDFLGYTLDELAEMSIEELSYPDDLEKDMKMFGEIVSGYRTEYQMEKRYIHKNGQIKTGILTISKINEEMDDQVFLLVQILDITEKKQMEETINNRNECLKKSEKLAVVGQTAAVVAHEIRNPLTAIKGFMQLFTKEKEVNHAFLTIILDELNRVEEIISEFITIAKPHTEVQVPVQIELLLNQVIQLITSQALMKNQEINYYPISPTIPPVFGDPDSLKQVFLNIIQNALDALDVKGQVDISVYSDHYGVFIQISDNGCGISQERLAKLGEPYYSTKEKGTGLGLMTSFRIIDNHNGKIQIESIERNGTKVTVWFPFAHKVSAL